MSDIELRWVEGDDECPVNYGQLSVGVTEDQKPLTLGELLDELDRLLVSLSSEQKDTLFVILGSVFNEHIVECLTRVFFDKDFKIIKESRYTRLRFMISYMFVEFAIFGDHGVSFFYILSRPHKIDHNILHNMTILNELIYYIQSSFIQSNGPIADYDSQEHLDQIIRLVSHNSDEIMSMNGLQTPMIMRNKLILSSILMILIFLFTYLFPDILDKVSELVPGDDLHRIQELYSPDNVFQQIVNLPSYRYFSKIEVTPETLNSVAIEIYTPDGQVVEVNVEQLLKLFDDGDRGNLSTLDISMLQNSFRIMAFTQDGENLYKFVNIDNNGRPNIVSDGAMELSDYQETTYLIHQGPNFFRVKSFVDNTFIVELYDPLTMGWVELNIPKTIVEQNEKPASISIIDQQNFDGSISKFSIFSYHNSPGLLFQMVENRLVPVGYINEHFLYFDGNNIFSGRQRLDEDSIMTLSDTATGVKYEINFGNKFISYAGGGYFMIKDQDAHTKYLLSSKDILDGINNPDSLKGIALSSQHHNITPLYKDFILIQTGGGTDYTLARVTNGEIIILEKVDPNLQPTSRAVLRNGFVIHNTDHLVLAYIGEKVFIFRKDAFDQGKVDVVIEELDQIIPSSENLKYEFTFTRLSSGALVMNAIAHDLVSNQVYLAEQYLATPQGLTKLEFQPWHTPDNLEES